MAPKRNECAPADLSPTDSSAAARSRARKRTRSRPQRRLESPRGMHEEDGGHRKEETGGSGLWAASSCSPSSLAHMICEDAPSHMFVPRTSSLRASQRLGRRGMLSLAATLLLSCASMIYAHDAFFVPPYSSRHHSPLNPLMSIQRKTPQNRRRILNPDTTWSNAVREKSELNESRFGVRKRVKNVLDKAKKRTGIENASTSKSSKRGLNGDSSFVQTAPNIVAETASIGGWEGVVVDEEGSVDVALDYVSNGGTSASAGGTGHEMDSSSLDSDSTKPTSSEEKYEDPAILTKLADGKMEAAQINGATVRPAPSTSTTIPSPAPVALRRPEDNFVVRKKDNVTAKNDTTSKPYAEKDAFTGDVSAAFSLPREPLPFELPTLDAEQYRRVKDGERVQFQDDMGRAGSGFVVWDVKAPASVVWDCLLDFKSYPQTIPTVREVVMYTNTHLKEDYRAEKPLDFEDGTAAICKHGVPSVTRAQFSLSKFRLKIAAVHKYRPHPKGDYMIFTLDPASRNMALKYAKGIWYTESNPDGKEGYTRVWLLCELRVSRLLPQWIVDYAASRAMPRATTWLKPQTEAAAQLWLKDSAER